MGGCCSDLKGGKEAVGGAVGVIAAGNTISSSGAEAASASGDAVDYFLHHQGLGGLASQLELSLSASKLRNLDYASKSDPMAVIYTRKIDGTLEEIGRTEVIMNTLNPVWITKVIITYHFEIVQPLMFKVYDVDTKYHNVPVKTLKLKDQEFLGEANCVLSEIITNNTRRLTLDLQNIDHSASSKSFGTITIHAEEAVSSRAVVEVTFRCSDLVNKDIFSKSDTPLIIECYDFEASGKHQLIGKVQKTVADLENLCKERIGVSFYSHSGVGHDNKKMLKSQLFVDKFDEKSLYTFVDYISSGFELSFMVAVDFTASNGNPQQPSSLHYIDPSGRLNSYQQAILEVGGVIHFYDSDKQFPTWGFGGRPIGGSVSHCFNLNGSNSECEVLGIDGIMSAYAMALQNVTLAGPTLFGPVINKAAQIASQCISFNPDKYFILLIITDGVITDIEETKDAIVKASDLPLSILIIGVGGADFNKMEILDVDDGKRLESPTGRIATRDIVQFVPMREVQGGRMSIVQSLLEELPGQFLVYMRSRNIIPHFDRDS